MTSKLVQCVGISVIAAVLAITANSADSDFSADRISAAVTKSIVLLENGHLSEHPFNAEISCRAWTNLFSALDFNRMVFTQTDLDRFTNRMERLGEELRAGKATLAFEVHKLFAQRIQERINYATNFLIQGKFDFSVKEYFECDRSKASWPKSREDCEELWRQQVKNDWLIITLNRELTAEKEFAATNGVTNVVSSVTNAPSLSPKETLLRRYRQYAIASVAVEPEMIVELYLNSITEAYDPHSGYMGPLSSEDFEQEMSLSLQGVGATLSMEDGALKVIEIIPGGPIARDGRIHRGDRIVGVDPYAKGGPSDMEDILYKPLSSTIRKIRGPKGSKVILEIIPSSDLSGTTRKRITLVRDEIKLEDQAATGRVERVVLNGATNYLGYVCLSEFYGDADFEDEDWVAKVEAGKWRSCSRDVAKWISHFNARGTDGMILDLRGNGGGSLPESILLAQLFLHRGYIDSEGDWSPYPVVQVKNNEETTVLSVFPDVPCFAYRKPVLVLIDRLSASASEIVAGVLRDSGRAVVVGDHATHGKGTVQTIFPFFSDVDSESEIEKLTANEGSIRLTTAAFYRIDGYSTQIRGVKADILLPGPVDQLDIGEDKLPCALPWTRIRSTDFKPMWDLPRHVSVLKAASGARLAQNKVYAKHLLRIKHMKELADRKVVSLERNERLKMLRHDRSFPDYDNFDDGELGSGIKGKIERDNQDDVVLQEAFCILADLVRLTGGNEVPPEPSTD